MQPVDKASVVDRRMYNTVEVAQALHISMSTLKRAISHQLVRVVYFGDRPLVPVEEFNRLAREGLADIPPGYKRMTTGPSKGGRPRKSAAAPSAKGKAPRRKRVVDERRTSLTT